MILNTLSTITQDAATLSILFFDVEFIRNNDLLTDPDDFHEKIYLGAAATSTVAILILPLVGRCFKTSSTIPQKLRFAASALHLGAAVGRGYTGVMESDKVFSIIEVTSTLLQEVALHKQRHLLAGLGAAGRLYTRMILFVT